MKHRTYETLYQAHLGNVNQAELIEVRSIETDPFYQNLIDLILEKQIMKIDWKVEMFTENFRAGVPRERLDETVFAFILRLVDINKEERYIRTFRKPETYNAIMAWDALLRNVMICSFALLYKVQWTPQSLLTLLEPAVMKLLSDGNPLVLRELMAALGIVVAQETPYQAEKHWGKLNFLHTGQYSAFYWRYLHWMAEAFHLRKEASMTLYRTLWVELVNESLYRTLRCGMCMHHFRSMLTELKPQLTEEESHVPKLWFDMHNQVHALRRKDYPYLKEPDYTELEYEEDRVFMLKAL